MSIFNKILNIALIFSLVCNIHYLESVKSRLAEEGYCDLLPHCVCIHMSSMLSSSNKLVCEGEINMQVTSGILLHPQRFSTFLVLYCFPNISPHILNQNYYALLNLQSFPSEINSLYVKSCPEPPLPYFSFVSPTSLHNLSTGESPNITLNTLTIDCVNFTKKFSLQRKHLMGLNSLKYLNITCPTLFEIPADLFQDTTVSLYKLNIFATQISTLPSVVLSSLSGLTELLLNKNQIHTLPNNIFNSQQSLGTLDLSENRLLSLDDGIFLSLNNLRFLNLSKNHLSHLPKSTSSLFNLTVLDASRNSLDKIIGIENLNKLKRLYLMNNKLTYLEPSIITSLENIKRIDVSGNSIIKLDKFLSPLNSLVDFILNHNSQPELSIQPFIEGTDIEIFIISNSSIVSLHPELLGNMPSLKKVDFSNNKLNSIPADLFSKSSNLYSISLQKNNISYLHANVFSGNPKLGYLNISSNRIKILSASIFSNNLILKTLDISRNLISVLPNDLLYHQNILSTLIISDNNITSFHPTFLKTNIEIEVLDFSGNMLDSLSTEIFMPFKDDILKLNLARNHLSSLPLLHLPRLRYLNLSYNKLESLPEGVFQNLSSLEILIVSNNHLKNISNSSLLPDNLRMTLLDLSQNHLSYIPQRIFKNRVIYINSIDFSGNLMESFYMDRLGNVKDLTELYVANNSLTYFGIEPGVHYWELFPSVKLLDLSNNKLDFKEAGWFYDDLRSTWGKVTALLWFVNVEVILLSNNSISRIFLDWRDDLHKLRLLDLRYNKIRQLQHQDIMFTSPNAPRAVPIENTIPKKVLHPRLKNSDAPPAPPAPLTVDLRWNLIGTVNIPLTKVVRILLERNGTIPEGIYGHSTILLDENPFVCDCRMLYFMRIVQNDVAPISDMKRSTGKDWVMPAMIDVGNLSCWEPDTVRGKRIAEPETWIHHLLPLMSLCSLRL